MFFSKPSDYSPYDYRSRNFKGNWTKHFINDFIDSISSKGSVETKKEFANFKEEHLPLSLYKFFTPTIYSLMGILQGTVHLSSPRLFNDPFDSYLCVNREEFIKKYVLFSLKKQGLVKDIEESKDSLTRNEYWEIYYSHCEDDNNYRLNSFWSTYYEIIQRKSESFKKMWNEIEYEAQRTCNDRMKYLRNTTYRISCFSHFTDENELMENTTMWSHYADNHHGFCVKYSLDFTNCKFSELLLCGLFPVKYTAKTEKITANQLLNLKEDEGEIYLNNFMRKKLIKSLLTKSRFWSYEKEWRLILSEYDCYLLSEDNISFPKIDAIYMGCRIEKSIKQIIIELGDKMNINIYETKQSDDKFILSCSHVNSKIFSTDEYYQKLSRINSIKDNYERYVLLKVLSDNYNPDN